MLQFQLTPHNSSVGQCQGMASGVKPPDTYLFPLCTRRSSTNRDRARYETQLASLRCRVPQCAFPKPEKRKLQIPRAETEGPSKWPASTFLNFCYRGAGVQSRPDSDMLRDAMLASGRFN